MDVAAVVVALRAGKLPDDARDWLVAGFEQWQAGVPLEAAMGLDTEPLDRRDDLLRVVLKMAPGESDAARCAFVVDCMDGILEHPSPMAQRLMDKLLVAGVQIPRSVRHLGRILNGGRAPGWTKNAVLCPSWPRPQNPENSTSEAQKWKTKARS